MSRNGCLLLLVVSVFLVAGGAEAQHAPYYVLDGFGGIHAGGGAGAIFPSTPYFGFDAAVEIAYVPVGSLSGHGDGVLVLDGFGGVHAGGVLAASPPGNPTPYFGFHIARSLAYRLVAPRAIGSADAAATTISVTSATFTALRSVTIHTPDDGFLLVTGSTAVSCAPAAATLVADLSVNVDTTAVDTDLNQYQIGFPDCSILVNGFVPRTPVSMSKLYAVTAGEHTVHLLGRKSAGTGTAAFLSKSITVVFIDQDGNGSS